MIPETGNFKECKRCVLETVAVLHFAGCDHLMVLSLSDLNFWDIFNSSGTANYTVSVGECPECTKRRLMRWVPLLMHEIKMDRHVA